MEASGNRGKGEILKYPHKYKADRHLMEYGNRGKMSD
jgi:hypothetical protein